MAPDTLSVVIPAAIALLVAVLANIGAWFLIRPQRKKTSAEAADVLTGAALRIVEKLQLQVETLEGQVAELEVAEEQLKIDQAAQNMRLREVSKLNLRLLRGNALLITQITDMGEEPIWRIADERVLDAALDAELTRLENALS